MSDPTLPPAVQELVDRMAIDDLITRCTMAIDNCDWGEFDAIFSADAMLDFTSAGGKRSGLEESKQWLDAAMSPLPVSQHLLGVNRRINIEGDRASVRAYVFNPMFVHDGAGVSHYAPGGSYHNYQFARTDDGWRILELVGEVLWREGMPESAAQ